MPKVTQFSRTRLGSELNLSSRVLALNDLQGAGKYDFCRSLSFLVLSGEKNKRKLGDLTKFDSGDKTAGPGSARWEVFSIS